MRVLNVGRRGLLLLPPTKVKPSFNLLALLITLHDALLMID